MKSVAVLLMLIGPALCAQTISLSERPNASTKTSLFVPTDKSEVDEISSIRASGQPFLWNVTPVIWQSWNGSKKSLDLAVEVVGRDLKPSTAVLVIDGATYVIQSAEWQPDSRGNLCAIFEKEGIVRNLASAQSASITVFAPTPVTGTFRHADLETFRWVAAAYDANSMSHSTPAGSSTTQELAQAPVGLIIPKKLPSKMQVKLIENESSVTPYFWEIDGRVSVDCYGDSCRGYYTQPQSGTQHIQGALLKLLRPDSSVAIAQCIAKVDTWSTISLAIDAVNANDPNSPTVYRNCRIPEPNTFLDAKFHKDTVKLSWFSTRLGRSQSETYRLVGILEPATTK